VEVHDAESAKAAVDVDAQKREQSMSMIEKLNEGSRMAEQAKREKAAANPHE
jgi:hypothetical protein